MKHLLVTGGCGFIGANFIRYLLTETDFNGQVVNVDKLTYAGNPESLAEFYDDKRYTHCKVDICDRDALGKVFDEFQIDSVCHFAAESHVDRSIHSPGEFIHTNIIGTFNLLEHCRVRSEQVVKFHHVSTDEVFGSLGEEGLFTEATSYKPNSPYSASKASSDHLVRAYNKTYGTPVTISNCSNNYGPYQFPEKLIPLMILNAKAGESLPVYGDGLNVRDWLYVRDHCTALWLVMTKGVVGETYNVGGNNEMPNLTVVEMICDLVAKRMGKDSLRDLISFVTDRPGHDRRYAIDSSKIMKELAWKPEETFETGLAKTVDWYLENDEWIEHVRSGEYQHWMEKNYSGRS